MKISAVTLAGGQNRRLGGEDKGLVLPARGPTHCQGAGPYHTAGR